MPIASGQANGPGRFARVALVHDWLTIPGGSEQVLLNLLELFPAGEIFTAVYDPAPWPEALTSRRIHRSFLDRIPGSTKTYRLLLPLMNVAFEGFDLRDFDLVVSSNHAYAKNVLTRPETLHVCYCHTPMRYAWEPRFLEGERVPLKRLAQSLFAGRIRREDFIGSSRPDYYVANSRHVATRIAKYYRRDAHVIHPPVDVDKYRSLPRAEGDYYLYLGRLVPYKRADLAIEACRRLGRKLWVAGGGRARERLRSIAGPETTFLGHLPEEDLRRILAGARALIFPGEEDFGIVPVEAQAAGVPVVAYGVGGATETVVDGETGVLFEPQTVDALCEAILRFESTSFDEQLLREHSAQFSSARFQSEFADFLERVSR
jgi:glycosyltransferase involved in cell wall biosynthesis